MLTQLRLQNFRCFRDHTLPIRPCTVIVGKNNAGKSTLVDALRIVSIASSRYLRLAIVDAPDWGGIPRRDVGVSPSIEGMGFNTTNLFHRYGREPAIITATFESGGALKIYVGPEGRLHAVLLNPTGRVIRTRASATESGVLSRVEIMPQVAPVETSEVLLRPDYVRRNLSSTLSPRHFRNQLALLDEHWDRFQQVSAETWPGLRIQELNRDRDGPEVFLSLLVRNDDYVAEIAAMGHGLQMWLQTMWFLARSDASATIILDEPDVYMHPDLQRRLIRFLRSGQRQTVITTHSVEIMSEVGPQDILVLDRQRRASTFAATFPAAQQVLNSVGSAHNLQLARLWHARRALFVEGKDLKLLAVVFDLLFPEDRDGIESIPHLPIGGWGGWPYAIGSAMFLRNAAGADIRAYCMLDSDYHSDGQKQARLQQASERGVQLHIWSRKEIENYLLVPTAIARAVERQLADGDEGPSVDEVRDVLDAAAEGLRDATFDGLAAEYLAENRGLGPGGANQLARDTLAANWGSLEHKLAIVSGKDILARLAAWSHEQYGVSLNATKIVRSFRVAEIPDELRDVLRAIANGAPFA